MRDLLLCVPRKVLSPNDFTDTTQIRDRLAVFDLTWAKIVDLRVLRVAELRVYRMIMDLVRTNREVRGGLAAWRRLRWRTVITRFGVQAMQIVHSMWGCDAPWPAGAGSPAQMMRMWRC